MIQIEATKLNGYPRVIVSENGKIIHSEAYKDSSLREKDVVETNLTIDQAQQKCKTWLKQNGYGNFETKKNG